ncbi:MAG: DEAD/DEAH box helicase [Spirochaetaceae bacterium]|jgi:ATP-dependent RNA helicase RhlB|nr:DEAD/DEAH box helicase [Spirochaetaceae bacterium]
MEFQTLNIAEELKKALLEAGYINAMPVQEKVVELGLDGRDLYVQSQTGTGKTAAFLIVIFHRLMTDAALKGRKALVMVPTRELAVQVEEEAKVLGKYLPFGIGSFYGGVGYGEQQRKLRDDVQILVGTPGRVLDLNSSGEMNLMDIAFLVLDEADRMFDMGFYPDLRKLIKVVPPPERRQTMLFSATLNVMVKNLALEYTKDPLEIEIEPEHITVEEIDQVLYHVPSEKKFSLLLGIMKNENPESAIIFCNTKRYTETVARRLGNNGIRCEFISGDLPQKKRLALIEDFKAGKFRYLAATDVAARGLDIEALALVVNYDLPSEEENYVHRIGRTARAGANGRAISFASEQDVYDLAGIERYIGKKIPAEVAGESMYAEEQRRGGGQRYNEEHSGAPARGRGRGRGGRQDARGDRRETAGDKQMDRDREPDSGAQKQDGGAGRQDGAQKQESKSSKKKSKLARMTPEKRREFYERKYGADATPRKSREEREDKNKRRGGQGKGRARNNSGAERGGGQGHGQRKGRDGAAAQKERETAAPKPQKTGVLAKLAGLFKKKTSEK